MPERNLAKLEARIGYRFKKRSLLISALQHSSSTTDHLSNNERLEFLGDAVLSLVMNNFLYRVYARCREGELTRIKSFTVSTSALDRRARILELASYAQLGGGLLTRSGRDRGPLPPSVHANLFEAVAAAVYLDGGWAPAEKFVLDQLVPEIEHMMALGHDRNFKSLLQQYSQSSMGSTPRYKLVSCRGPDHRRRFQIAVHIGRKRYPPATGASKKEAEQIAAENALRELEQMPEPPGREDRDEAQA